MICLVSYFILFEINHQKVNEKVTALYLLAFLPGLRPVLNLVPAGSLGAAQPNRVLRTLLQHPLTFYWIN